MPLDKQDVFAENLDFLLKFWRKMVELFTELGKLDLTQRKIVRETLLTDSANTIYAMLQLARTMKNLGQPIASLENLPTPVGVNGQKVSFLSRTNPAWVTLGVLVPGEKVAPDGPRTLALRNSRQARNAILDEMLGRVRMKKGAPEPEAAAVA